MVVFYKLGQWLLRLKHWHILVLFILLLILGEGGETETQRLVITEGNETYTYEESTSPFSWWSLLVMSVFFTLPISCGFFLIEKANRRIGSAQLSKWAFALSLIGPFAVMLMLQSIQQWAIPDFEERAEWSREHFTLGFFIMAPIVLTVFFAISRITKAIDSAEQRREVHFPDYLVTFIQFMFYFPFTMWILQPRLNSLAKNGLEIREDAIRPAVGEEELPQGAS